MTKRELETYLKEKRWFDAEVEQVSRTLYTLAGYAEPEKETTIEKLTSLFAGYNPDELRTVAKNAKEAVNGFDPETKKILARRICRDDVNFLVANARVFRARYPELEAIRAEFNAAKENA